MARGLCGTGEMARAESTSFENTLGGGGADKGVRAAYSA